MTATAFQESSKPLLRPNQVSEITEEKRRLESIVQAPPYIAAGVDRGEAARQLRRISTQLDAQTPRPYEGEEKDAAVKREAELREQFTTGMPTQSEMRRNPAGAVDKNIQWEARNKKAVLEWKNIRRRLFVGGDLPASAGEVDHANIEMYRPQGGAGELNMHNEQITAKQFHFPPPGAGQTAVMSQEQSEALKALDPDLHSKMALLSNNDRGKVLDVVNGLLETRQKRLGGLEKAREAKAQKDVNPDG